jgi:hypothetical protein
LSLVLGIDLGTSGVRAAACGRDGSPLAIEAAPLPPPRRAGARVEQDPALWWDAVEAALSALVARIDPRSVEALAVDGTSGTVLAVDAGGEPLAPARMYNDADGAATAARIAGLAPRESGAHGATSGLAKALEFAAGLQPHRILHQADWIAGRLLGRYAFTDENNALKTGYDPVERRWPAWIRDLGIAPAILPEVREPGSALGPLSPAMARRFGLKADVVVAAGTTDGCASFLATGARRPGDAVTALGSTLTLKMLSDRPLFAPEAGVYSHRLGAMWLAGGASNTGGAVIARHFSPDALAALEGRLRPERPTGLDYYPLLQPGERFPVADPALAPRLDPRPEDDALFLQGLLESIARIEGRGYAELARLGAPPLRRVLSVGGGARNAAWTAIRRGTLSVPVERAQTEEAAVGAARLARQALAEAA